MTTKRVLYLIGALLAGVVGSVLAPADWEIGEGKVILEYQDTAVVSEAVEIGIVEPVAFAGQDSSLSFELIFPGGIPTDDTVVALVRTTTDGVVVTPEPGDIQVHLLLPNQVEESIPVVAWDSDEEAYLAQRRPPQSTAIVLGLLGFVVVAWVTEALPLFVTSLFIPIVLVVGEVFPASEATAPFFHPIIVLFFAGFLMAEAMRRSRLDHYISVTIISKAGRSAPVLYATMIGVAAFMSMWMSNTAAIAILVPIALAVTAPLEHPGFRKAVVLGIAYAGTIGGVGSAIGTPANQLAIEFLDTFTDRSIAFVEWFAFGLPMVVLLLPVMGLFLWWRAGVKVAPHRFEEASEVAEKERHQLGGALDRHQAKVLAIFGLVFVGWLTQTFHGVHPGIVALVGAVALFIVSELKPEDLGRISWESLLTFGGGLTLGLSLVATGTSDYLATRLEVLSGVGEVLAVLAVATITLLLTTVASNTASAAILIPVALPLASVLGVDPTLLVVVVAIASSVDFALVVGTPPTMIAYSTRLYTAGEIFRKGIVLDAAGILLLVLGVTRIWEWLGLF